MVMKLSKAGQGAGEAQGQRESRPPVSFCTPAVWAGKEHCNANLPCASGDLCCTKEEGQPIGRPRSWSTRTLVSCASPWGCAPGRFLRSRRRAVDECDHLRVLCVRIERGVVGHFRADRRRGG